MRLSWQDIRARAAKFAASWAGASYEKGETQSFYNEFFEIFGVRRRSVARYEEHVHRLDNRRGFIDLFWPGVLLVEQKSAGHDLAAARKQAKEYFDSLKPREQPRYLLLSDFRNFELLDLDEGTEVRFELAELPDNVENFSFILGLQPRKFRDQDPVNIEASVLMGEVYDELSRTGFDGPELELVLVRLLFCLFADDTGIFEPRDSFHEMLLATREDGSDLGRLLAETFEVLNSPEDKRSDVLSEEFARLPFVNGPLFKERLPIATFDATMREKLIEASGFNWSKISPAIFGALFQSVMKPKERRESGAHYTTEQNVLKVIEPLFMDGLRQEFQKIRRTKGGQRKSKLLGFQRKLAGLKFFDPACGCGNFLIIAYRELRLLEMEVIKEHNPDNGNGRQQHIDSADLSMLNVDQFYGMEIGAFPVRIAETAMWMMDHFMNNELSLVFGRSFLRIPLETSPNIMHCDALETDWNELLPASECSHVFGNPPFAGSKQRIRKQSEQLKRVAGSEAPVADLDYVAAWFILAGRYVQEGEARIAFVATNSIAQGEQAGKLWPILHGMGLEISFAHRTFAWGSDARGKAHVDVVIAGLDKAAAAPKQKRLYHYEHRDSPPMESMPRHISPYLIDANGLRNRRITVESAPHPINSLPKLQMGTQPIDNGIYILDRDERSELESRHPEVKRFIRPFVNAKGLLHKEGKGILFLRHAPAEIRKKPLVRQRIDAVSAYRAQSRSGPTRDLSPTEFNHTVMPASQYLAIPSTSSEKRDYVPMDFLQPPVVPSNAILVLENAEQWHFALLTSAMHMAWLRQIGGRLTSRYRYSIGVVYNTFPLPNLTAKRKATLKMHAKKILDERIRHPRQSLADLYDRNIMPSGLQKAHRALDKAVDGLYRRKKFVSEADRLQHLLSEYEKLVVPPAENGSMEL